MATNVLSVTITTQEDLGTQANTWDIQAGKNPDRVLNHLSRFAAGVAMGIKQDTTVDIQLNGGSGVAASGTLTLSSASGTVGGIINGVTITASASGGDTASAVLVANAINASANALVVGVVTATSALGVVTVTAVTKGKAGNAVTLAASGTGVTASGARLTAGANASANSFTL